MKKLFGLLTMIATIAFFSSCTKDVLRGSGRTVTETRNLPSFESIELVGNRNAEIIYSAEPKVELTGYENLVPAYTAKVSQGRLYFEYPSHQVVHNDNIRLKIYTPAIIKATLVGNADVKVETGFIASEFKAELSGNGKLRFAPNQFDTLEIRTSGNAEVFAEPVVAKKADVLVSGNAYIEVRATNRIRIQVSGSGNVNYWGNPADTDVSISGNGRAIRH